MVLNENGSSGAELSALASFGMFGASIVVSKWLLRRRQAILETENIAAERVALMEWYIARRSQDRLSFHQLPTGPQFSSASYGSLSGSDGDDEFYAGDSDSHSDDNSFSSNLDDNLQLAPMQGNCNHFEPHPDTKVSNGMHQRQLSVASKNRRRKERMKNRVKKQKNGRYRFSLDLLKQKSFHDSNLDEFLEGEDIRVGCADDDSVSGSSAADGNSSLEEKQKWRGPRRRPKTEGNAKLKTIFSQTTLQNIEITAANTENVKNQTIPTLVKSSPSESSVARTGVRSFLNRSASLDVPSGYGTSKESVSNNMKSNNSSIGPGSIPPSLFSGTTLKKRTSSSPNLESLFSAPFSTPSPAPRTKVPDAAELEQMLISQNRSARVNYNARIMPNRVILVRHGQSMGNLNELLYSTTPDNAMPLTKLGWKQANEAGKFLKELFGNQSSVTDDFDASNRPTDSGAHFIVSPYVRTVETLHGILSAWCDPAEFKHIEDEDKRLAAWYARLMELGLSWQEDPRIREQDFGNYQEPEMVKKAKKDRHRFGAFYYRFPHGESASDVYDRVSTFLDSLWRSFETNRSRNYVLITHGISIRVFLARYFRYTIGQFHLLANPRNCEMVLLAHDGAGRLELAGRYELEMNEEEEKEGKVVGYYKYHRRLRVLPQRAVRKVKIRMSAIDNMDVKE